MKTEEFLSILSLIKDRSKDVKVLIDDFQQISERMAVVASNASEIAKIAKDAVERIEDIARKPKG